ncbi:hypothetical protein BJ875DRAFT_415061 [Amylocarpus encephaloides]|uniref:Uncharacterized protein n=1 Tax=Amylocarpus encephaloides TaxID=45428 RepID=A0A9P8C9Y2_9HELO|nr:hypothetical protein BJ875DRAFT_415061 [Amylocarpus encephaloides]
MSQIKSNEMVETLTEIAQDQRVSSPLLLQDGDPNGGTQSQISNLEASPPSTKIEPILEKNQPLQAVRSIVFEPSPTNHQDQRPWNTKHLQGIYWLSPFGMISFLCLGIIAAVTHQVYYQSFAGKVVRSNSEQQRSHEAGNFFAWVVQSSLAMSMTFAYIQYLWMTLKDTEVSIQALNAAFAAPTSWLFIFNYEMLRKISVGYLLAISILCMPIPSLFTPGTLLVVPKDARSPAIQPVRVLNISDPAAANFYTYSVSANGSHELSGESMMFLGPRTIIKRLAVAAASTGEILPISPPYVNSSYNIQFYGPTVECKSANARTSAMIASRVKEQMQTMDDITQVLNGYFAYVPDLSDPNTAAPVTDRVQQPSKGSNELWLSFKRNGTGFSNYPVPTCPITEYRVCQLFNASYELNLTFVDGNQTITGLPPRSLNRIDYPVTNFSEASNLAQHSYTAFMWVFTEQLLGTMGFYNNTQTNITTPAKYTQIRSTVQATSLLGSSDLECFFAQHHIVTDEFNVTTFTEDSPQRKQDINFAKNQTLDVLIPELAYNTTISFMNDEVLAPRILHPILVTTTLNIYLHSPLTLLLAYSISLTLALLANLLGAYAYLANKVAHDLSFSTLASTTTDQNLVNMFREEDPGTRGKLPLPKGLGGRVVRFTPLDEGGLGFQTADEVRRRRSLGSAQMEGPSVQRREP